MDYGISEMMLGMYIGGFICGALLLQISLLNNPPEINVKSRPTIVALGVMSGLVLWPILLPVVLLYQIFRGKK